MPTQTGATCNAANSSAFQTCLNNAAYGDTIVLTAGTTYTGNFILPVKSAVADASQPSGSKWIVIRTSNMAGIPAEGTRINPSVHASAMPIITSANADVVSVHLGY